MSMRDDLLQSVISATRERTYIQPTAYVVHPDHYRSAQEQLPIPSPIRPELHYLLEVMLVVTGCTLTEALQEVASW